MGTKQFQAMKIE